MDVFKWICISLETNLKTSIINCVQRNTKPKVFHYFHDVSIAMFSLQKTNYYSFYFAAYFCT